MKIRILEVIAFCAALVSTANAQTPSILSEPQSATNNTAAVADFTVVATNAATYQWYFQGTNALAGATNATLTLDDLSTNQAGSYTVVVTSPNNLSVTSAPPAVLTIIPGTIVQFTVSTYPGGGSNSFLVQLFDHDKPATVENFIHYITSGAYSNMFFDRDVPNFVLQGGDYVSLDRTTNSLNITNVFTGTNIFPSQLDTEVHYGPLIPNEFGTLAMAFRTGNPNSASSAFYFNTTNNSPDLDTNGGGFTVFGRILYGTNSGSNDLQYFNTLSVGNGLVVYSSSNYSIPNLPVNYTGTNAPTDANLFYCGFTFITPPPVDTTPPTVSITFPASNSIFTNASTLTAQGIAQDNIGLAEVFCVLTGITGPSAGISTTNPAVGTTNWSINLGYPQPGLYQLTAYAQDGAGNLSLPATVEFTALIPPIILSQPTNVTVVAGANADLTVTAANAASYQWESSAGAILGATNATLVLTNVTTNLSGSTYEVVVTAPDGQSVTSAPIVLTVVSGTLVQITFSGYPDGSSSNVVVQLYDHEKPATVANFLRYITPVYYFGFEPAMAYSNMFWERCIPGVILQGGDYDLPNRTSGNPLNQLESIYDTFTTSFAYAPRFAEQVDNEFDTGPELPNTFGTLAMAKYSGYPDSAANGFFFNLGDNSANFDTQNGGYTVFGRIISGSNVLQYFNTLNKPNQGIFDSSTIADDSTLTDLPVNYRGWAQPANSNLFFADFTLLSMYPADATAPAIAITFPTNGQTVTNAHVIMQGVASDNVAVANVACTAQGPNFYNSVFAIGTTNWTADFGVLPPGAFTVTALAQDGSGNFSAQSNRTFTVPRFPFNASVTGNGTLSTNLNGTNVTIGSTYTITAKPGRGSVFVNWSAGTNASLNPTHSFTMQNGLQLTANFITNNVPGGLSITHPGVGAELTNATFSIEGTLGARLRPAQVSCQVYAAKSGNSVSSNMVINATNGVWAAPSITLAPGDYIVRAVARDGDGHAAMATHAFTILAPLSITIYGHGRASIPNGAYLKVGTYYLESAEAGSGAAFLSWNSEAGAFPLPSFSFPMSEGLGYVLTFISNSSPGKLTITSPAANAQETKPAFSLGGKVASSFGATQVVCQLFQGNSPLTGFMPASMTETTWTVPVSNLTMGNYRAVAIATEPTGKTIEASEKFSLNFYPDIAGSYKGLFFDPAAVSETNAGAISFLLTPSGIAVGALMFPGHTYPLAVQMGTSGSATLEASVFNGYLIMNFDLTNLSGRMTGAVTQGSQSSPLLAYRAATKLSATTVPAPGHYVLSLEPETPTNGIIDGPSADSFATVKVSAGGNLAVAGALADNSSFSQSTIVFTNGVWPLYASFYKGHGMLIGWETNLPGGTNSGLLYWLKEPTNGLYDTIGVNEQLNSVGGKYVAPTSGAKYQIVLGGGGLSLTVSNQFSFGPGGAIIADDNTYKLKGSLVLSTGALKGSIANPTNGTAIDFRGVFASPTEGGAGFTLDEEGHTGYFDITPVEIVPGPADQ